MSPKLYLRTVLCSLIAALFCCGSVSPSRAVDGPATQAGSKRRVPPDVDVYPSRPEKEPGAGASAKPVDLLTRFEARTLESKVVAKGSLKYRLLTPDGYDSKADTKYPLVLFLHGAGERGTDNKAQLKWGGKELATALQSAGKCFVVAPQCPPNHQWVNTNWAKGSYAIKDVPISDDLSMALEATESAIQEFKIDADRIYVTGLSMGGYGTWDSIARRPELFAAAVPICGAGDPSSIEKIAPVSIWAFHGGADNVVPTKGSQDMAAALRQSGAGEPMFKYTEFPGIGHNAWTKAWETKGLWEWMLSRKRGK